MGLPRNTCSDCRIAHTHTQREPYKVLSRDWKSGGKTWGQTPAWVVLRGRVIGETFCTDRGLRVTPGQIPLDCVSPSLFIFPEIPVCCLLFHCNRHNQTHTGANTHIGCIVSGYWVSFYLAFSFLFFLSSWRLVIFLQLSPLLANFIFLSLQTTSKKLKSNNVNACWHVMQAPDTT